MESEGILKRISSRSPWSKRRRSLNINSVSITDMPNRSRTPSQSPLPLARFHRFAASLRLPPQHQYNYGQQHQALSPHVPRWSRQNSLPQGIRYKKAGNAMEQGLNRQVSLDYSETSNEDTSNCSIISEPTARKPQKFRSPSKRRTAKQSLSSTSIENKDGANEMNNRSRLHRKSSSDSGENGTGRKNVKEGRVILATGLQTQTRYLFLFNDTLLVAKEVKETYRGVSSHTYKLKEKIRVCELWVKGGGAEEVAECLPDPSLTFIIGWPTVNYVAKFQSPEERTDWYESLRSQINIQKQLEIPKVTTVNVNCKRSGKLEIRSLTINNQQTARDLLRLAICEFHEQDDYTHDLWVHFERETAPYPLYGHECPFAIFMTHMRDNYPDFKKAGIPTSKLEDLARFQKEFGIKCRFILRPKSGNSNSLHTPRKNPRLGRSNWIQEIKRKMTRSSSADPQNKEPPPTGELFGHPLGNITVLKEEGVPAPVKMMIEHIFEKGVFLEGIFRKPPKQSSVKALKSRLDKGEQVEISEEYYPLVTASVLKDFLRNIPNKLLISDYYYDWVAAYNEKEPTERARAIRTVLSRLPPANYQLLKHLLCLLHHVHEQQAINHMNSTSLSVCIGPSLLDPGRSGGNAHSSARQIPRIVQMLIDDFENLFGSESIDLFGKPPSPPPDDTLSKQDSSEESDIPAKQPLTSSEGSISSASGGESRPESDLSHTENRQSQSRDSGLSDLHISAYEENSNEKSISVNTNSTMSLDNLVPVFDDAVKKKYPTLERSTHIQDESNSSSMSQSWHQDSINDADVDDYIDVTKLPYKKPILTKQFSESKATSYRSDSIEEEEESPSKRSLAHLRSHKYNLWDATLHRSDSGEHLLLRTEIPADRTDFVLQSRKERSQSTKEKLEQADSGRESCGGGGSPDGIGRWTASKSADDADVVDQPSTSRFKPMKTVAEIYPLQSPTKLVHASHTHSEASSSGASSLSSLNGDDVTDGNELKSALRNNRTTLSKPTHTQYHYHTHTSSHKSPTCAQSTKQQNESSKQRSAESQKVGNLHELHTKIGDLASGRQRNGDSSNTVTEDEDEDLTPVVSRENSSAKELETKAKGMFSPKQNTKEGHPALIMTSHDVVQGPFVATSRPAWDRRLSANSTQVGHAQVTTVTPPVVKSSLPLMRSKNVANSMPNVVNSDAQFASIERKSERNIERSTTLKHEEAKIAMNEMKKCHRPLSHHESLLVRNSGPMTVHHCDHASTSSSVPPTYEETMRQRTPNPTHNLWAPGKDTILVPVEPGKVKERIRRYDREGLRRKTLAGDDFRAIATAVAAQQEMERHRALQISNAQPAAKIAQNRHSLGNALRNASCEKLNDVQSRDDGISWSVKRIKSMFDESNVPSCSDSNRPPPKPWAKCANQVYNNNSPPTSGGPSPGNYGPLSPPTEAPPRIPSSSNFAATPKYSSRSSHSVQTSSGRLDVSDAQGTYPVIRPPPLISGINNEPNSENETQYSLQLRPLSDKTIKSAGLVRALASSFEPSNNNNNNISNGLHKSESYV